MAQREKAFCCALKPRVSFSILNEFNNYNNTLLRVSTAYSRIIVCFERTFVWWAWSGREEKIKICSQHSNTCFALVTRFSWGKNFVSFINYGSFAFPVEGYDGGAKKDAKRGRESLSASENFKDFRRLSKSTRCAIGQQSKPVSARLFRKLLAKTREISRHLGQTSFNQRNPQINLRRK